MSLRKIFSKKVFKIFCLTELLKSKRLMLWWAFHTACLLCFLTVILSTGAMFAWWISSTFMMSKNHLGKSLALDLVSSHPWDKIVLVTAAVAKNNFSLDKLYSSCIHSKASKGLEFRSVKELRESLINHPAF